MKTQNKNITHNHNNTKKIKNWSKYNKSLKNRGNLSICISESLIKDGRIHPTRIEELYDKTAKEINSKIIEYGNNAIF